jgi:PPM family protein phosphatase
MNEAALIEVLRGSADFSSVSERSLGELARSGTVREPVVGTEIVTQGEPGQQLWILLTGGLEILIDGEPVNRISRPGDVVGQISAVSMTPATATVRVAEPSTCLCIPHRALHQLFGAYPDLAEALLRSMAKYLGKR